MGVKELTIAFEQTLWQFVPPDLRHRLFVAGGFAADHTKAEDIDLWVVGFSNLDEAVERLREHLTEQNVEWSLPDTHIYDGMGESELDNSEVAVVANFYNANLDMRVQLMATKHQTPEAVLETFDLSVHMWAFGLHRNIVRIARSTRTREPIKVERLTTPNRTLDRYYRLCTRYGQEPRQSEWSKLYDALEAKKSRIPASSLALVLAEGADDDLPF